MPTSAPKTVIADVRLSENLDRLVVTPRDPKEGGALSAALSKAFSHKLKRQAEGVRLPASICDLLLEVEVPADLRWTDEARLFVRNRHRAKKHHRILKREIDGITKGDTEPQLVLEDISGLDVLDRHQRASVAAMTLPEGYGLCIFDEQGAGKTVTLIFAFDVLVERDEVDFALIVAPKSMIPEWQRDFHRFKHDLYKVELVVGTRQQKKQAIRSGADVLVTNYETIVSMEPELRALLRRHQGRAMLAVDESFYVKNLDAKRTRVLRRLREWCGRAYVLCGTPAPNSPHDVVQQFNVTDFGITFDGLVIPDDPAQARDAVQRRIEEKGLYVRHLKTDVLPGLPGKSFNRIIVRLQPQQATLYAAALTNLIEGLQSVTDDVFQRNIRSFLAKRSSLLQICSNPIAVAQQYSEVPAKLHALDELLDNLVRKNSEKVVIWSFYTASLNAIFSRYDEFSPVKYDGSVTDVSARRNAVQRFQEDEHTMLFVANPAAAGAGLTLHKARFAIYESMSNQTAHYLQSLDRIHRRGQSRSVEYLVLLCDGTIELQEYARLKRKEADAQQLFHDRVVSAITRESMLNEAYEAERFLSTIV